ncbi:MAG: NAD(P)/FAD-dependent oxidoreductase [Gemmatimonadetes bacterium]|nr:NAD(P)/FAD-dependent oxidoreductase [Gemmatimonadota bacterium]
MVGGGFAGLHCARVLRKQPVDVTLLDRTNHHLFQPLLYQVATATLAPTDISVPIRWVLRGMPNATVLMGEVRDVDLARRVVIVDDDRREMPYDYLVLATGARHAYFGHDEWEVHAPGLKSLEDALEIRRRFLVSFELAERCERDEDRAAYQTFVIVGGGPTGVELAGMLPELARRAFRRDFRRVDTRKTRVVLVEGGPRLLAAFPEKLAARARRDLESLGVEVRTKQVVTRVDADAVWIGDERIATHTVFWAAGNRASSIARKLGVPTDKAGRAIVEADLSVPGHPEVFVVGDAAAAKDPVFGTVPGVAPAAMQGGAHVGRQILASLRGAPRTPFRYVNKGNLATIGRNRAIADFGFFTMAGTPAWVFWLFLHIMYLVGFRNRVAVLVQWAYAYLTFQRGARLITGRERGEEEARLSHTGEFRIQAP